MFRALNWISKSAWLLSTQFLPYVVSRCRYFMSRDRFFNPRLLDLECEMSTPRVVAFLELDSRDWLLQVSELM